MDASLGQRMGGVRTALPTRLRRTYLQWLAWLFALFNSARVFAYLPNVWSIHQHADSSQHSLLTWVTLFGANLTMAAWLYEENGHKTSKAIAVSISNSLMCLLTATSIVWYRMPA